MTIDGGKNSQIKIESTPVTISPMRDIQEEKTRRAELIQAASRLFRDKGYERTTVRDLAQAVGMQSGSLFYHFKTKEEMLVAVMSAGIMDITERARDSLDKQAPPLEQLRSLVRAHLSCLLGANQAALEVLLYEWHSLSPKARQSLLPLRDEYEQFWQNALDQAAQLNLVSKDTRLLRKFVLGGLHWTCQWYTPEGPLDVDAMADRLLQLWAHAP